MGLRFAVKISCDEIAGVLDVCMASGKVIVSRVLYHCDAKECCCRATSEACRSDHCGPKKVQ